MYTAQTLYICQLPELTIFFPKHRSSPNRFSRSCKKNTDSRSNESQCKGGMRCKHKRSMWSPVSSVLVRIAATVCFGCRTTKFNWICKERRGSWYIPTKTCWGQSKQEVNLEKWNPFTLNPADLRRRAVALLILSGDAKDDCWPVGCRAVDVGVVQVGGADGAGCLGAAVNPDEGHLAWPLWAGGAALLHRHVHGVLQNPARWRQGGLPCDLDWISGLRRNNTSGT